MTSLPPAHESDDEALSWDGENDSSHVAGPVPLREKPLKAKPARPAKPARASAEASAEADAGAGAGADTVTDEPQPTSSALLVTYGIVAGVYALYTVGWITTILRGSGTMASLLGEVMFQFGEFLAIAASPLWFAAVFFLTRGRKPIVRLGWLIVGLVLLVPIPFVMGA
jgi:hypothetical protein